MTLAQDSVGELEEAPDPGVQRARASRTRCGGTSSRKLQAGETLFPGVLGYDESVVPQVVNAILSRHNMILLGLRGQAKSRLLRSLTTLLDPQIPMVAGLRDPRRPAAPALPALPRRWSASAATTRRSPS